MTHYSWGDVATTDQSGSTLSPGVIADVSITFAANPIVLTVGVGQEYATLAQAIAVATNGSVILVNAGTYTNDFATITTKLTIVGVGGMANFRCDRSTNE